MRSLTNDEKDRLCNRVGKDNHNHLMLPWEGKALCGASLTKREDSQEYSSQFALSSID